jgi:hypothetical protein
MQPDFNTLVISIASSAVMSLGLEKNPMTGKVEKDLAMASFNIDLLKLLQVKTKGNLSDSEKNYLDAIVTDLQLKYVQVK